MKNRNGFSLIEVLIALSILAIALTAMLRSSYSNVDYTDRILNQTIEHWVALQGVYMVQLGLLPVELNQETSEVTTILNKHVYWRVKLNSTPIERVAQIEIHTSQKANGPFDHTLLAYLLLS